MDIFNDLMKEELRLKELRKKELNLSEKNYSLYTILKNNYGNKQKRF